MAAFAAAIASVHSAALVISVPAAHVAPSATRTWYGVYTHLTSTPPDCQTPLLSPYCHESPSSSGHIVFVPSSAA